jgi:hypothetical protein
MAAYNSEAVIQELSQEQIHRVNFYNTLVANDTEVKLKTGKEELDKRRRFTQERKGKTHTHTHRQ